MSIVERTTALSTQEKVRFFHLLASGICLHARGLASNSGKLADLRLLQSDAIIEMLHRIFEQSEHYYKQDDAQRPDTDLFQMLETIATKTHLHGIVSSASDYAFRKLGDKSRVENK